MGLIRGGTWTAPRIKHSVRDLKAKTGYTYCRRLLWQFPVFVSGALSWYIVYGNCIVTNGKFVPGAESRRYFQDSIIQYCAVRCEFFENMLWFGLGCGMGFDCFWLSCLCGWIERGFFLLIDASLHFFCKWGVFVSEACFLNLWYMLFYC